MLIIGLNRNILRNSWLHQLDFNLHFVSSLFLVKFLPFCADWNSVLEAGLSPLHGTILVQMLTLPLILVTANKSSPPSAVLALSKDPVPLILLVLMTANESSLPSAVLALSKNPVPTNTDIKTTQMMVFWMRFACGFSVYVKCINFYIQTTIIIPEILFRFP